MSDSLGKCALCGRELLNDHTTNKHHLIPKTFKGTETVDLHQICHNKIHSLFTERELLHTYHTIDALLSHDDMIKFVKWVAKKPPSFYSKVKEHTNRRKRR